MAGENKQIYQLTSRTFDGDSIIPFDRPNTDPATMADKPYLSGNCNGHDVADFIANTEEYTTDLDTTSKTITGAINELNTGKADAFTMKSLTASDVFSNTTNISQFYGYQIGKVIFITRLVVTGGTQTTDKTVYATFNNAYKPNVATRFVWDKNGDGILVRGVCDPTDGLSMSDGTSLGGLAFSFNYQIS